MKFKIYPLLCGKGQIIKSKLFYQGAPAAEAVPMNYACFLLKSEDGENIMVDSGYPFKEAIRKGGYEDVFPIREGSPENAQEMLAPYGVKPEEISKIFLTHLHYDHAWNLESYPNAKIYVQKKEIEGAIHPLPMLNEKLRAYSMHPKVYSDSWINSVQRFEIIDGDIENVIPGVSVMLTRGHSVGSQTIIVDTNDGRYAFPGDYAPSLDSIYKCIPTGMNISVIDWVADYPKVKRLMDEGVKFLSNHDLRTFEQKVYG